MDLERVQVMLRPEERAAVRDEATRLGISMSEVVRRALEPLVRERDSAAEDDPFFSIIGLIDDPDLPDDLSMNVKHYLYGWPKKGSIERPS
jgi:hypothetical protein